MKIFNLPDLGEGLADAEIREWHVKVGDEVKVDEPLVCMETAKAVVEVPSPLAGKIKKLYGEVNAVINTGSPLVEFEDTGVTAVLKDNGSVVGSLEESTESLNEGEVIIGSTREKTSASAQAMPAVRALAKQLNVDLNSIKGSGVRGQITAEDVKNAYSKPVSGGMGEGEVLHGVRRAMAQVMTQSHQEIVPVTIVDDADITDLAAKSDMTACLIQAIVAGCKIEPALNAWFDGKALQRRLFTEINIGLAMDTAEGLFVPVLKTVEKSSAEQLRAQIDTFKKTVQARTISPSDLQGATITLSNFGMLAGRYATPIIVPPMVAILGCGKIREIVAARGGKMEIRRIIPLSLTFDHRAVTGGEATRFLGAVMHSLESKT
jgi:2-oxoisovalerate dehydrogenase E2 component (dihydrolipoyl transacylase)